MNNFVKLIDAIMKKNVITILIIGLLFAVVVIMGLSYYISQSEYREYNRRDINEYLSVENFEDGTIGIINKSTSEIVGIYDELLSFDDGCTSSVLLVVKDALRGFISAKTGEAIFEPQFLFAWINNDNNNLAACVNLDEKMGFVNVETREIAIPFQYDFDKDLFCPNNYWGDRESILDFVFNQGFCIVPGKGGKIGLINEKGELIIPIEYVDIINWRDLSTPEIILKREVREDTYKLSFCDREFNPLSSIEYDLVEKIWDYGYQDSGEYVIELYGYIVKNDGLYGVLDKSLNTVLPIEYEYIYERNLPGEYNSTKCVVAVKNYVPKLYACNGTLLNDFYVESQIEYDTTIEEYVEHSGLVPISEPFNGEASGFIQYQLKDLYGIVDGTKRVVIPAKYDKIEYLGYGTFACILDGITYIKQDKN